MAQSMARRLKTLPAPGSQQYEIAVAELFGGSITAVMRKSADNIPAKQTDLLRYANGEHMGVIIGYPPTLAKILDLAHDLAPDIQNSEPAEISKCFPSDEWFLHSNAEVRYLVLKTLTGNIILRQPVNEPSRLVVLLRVYGSPTDTPFRMQLSVNQREIAHVDVYQADSFLLRGEIPSGNDTNLSLHLCHINSAPLPAVPPVTVPAIRVVSITGK
jgi:hypothetical protein